MDVNERTLLLVEDCQDDIDLTLLALRKNNITNHVVVVRDGVAALDYLLGSDTSTPCAPDDMPAVVLLDLKLPKIDGHEVLKRLRADARTQFLPVVVLTSSREQADLTKSYESGCNGYVRKPVDFKQFTQAARELAMYWLKLNEPPQ